MAKPKKKNNGKEFMEKKTKKKLAALIVEL